MKKHTIGKISRKFIMGIIILGMLLTLMPIAAIATAAPNIKASVTNPGTSAATVGTAWSLDLSSIFEDADGDTLTYSYSTDAGSSWSTVTGGTYSFTPETAGATTLLFKANDGIADSSANYSVTVTASAAASIAIDGTTTYYATFAEAQTALASASGTSITLTLLSDVTLAAAWSIGKNCTIELNNHTITAGNYNLSIASTMTVTIRGGTVTSTSGGSAVSSQGNLTLDNCTVNSSSGIAASQGKAGYTLTINSGTYSSGNLATSGAAISAGSGSVIINGGSFTGSRAVNFGGSGTLTLNGGSFKANLGTLFDTPSRVTYGPGKTMSATPDAEGYYSIVSGTQDTTVPTVTPGTYARTSDTAATVTFTPSEYGWYYYSQVSAGAPAPAITTKNLTGIACTSSATTANLTLAAGERDVYFVVKDASGNESPVTRLFTIPAYVSNAAPNIKASVTNPGTSAATVGTAWSLDLSSIFEDADGDTLTYSYSADAGSNWSAVTGGTYSFTPETAGATTLLFKANDGIADSSANYSVTVTAAATNAAPAIRSGVTNPGTGAVSVGAVWTLDLSVIFTDADNNPLTYYYSTDSGTTWTLMTGSTYRFTSTAAKTTTLLFKATDGQAYSGTYTIDVIATNAAEPSFTATTNVTGNSVFLTVSVSGNSKEIGYIILPIYYNKSVFDYVGSTAGAVLNSITANGDTLSFAAQDYPDAASGAFVSVSAYSINSIRGATGNGEVFTVEFRVKNSSLGKYWFQASSALLGLYYDMANTSFSIPVINDISCIVGDPALLIPVTGVALNHTAVKLRTADAPLQLMATVSPDNATQKDLAWTSSDTDVATVSSTGLVTAKAAGTATITATAQDNRVVAGTCEVTVEQSVTGIALADYQAEQIAVAGTSSKAYTVSPADAYDKSVIWASSNPAVATVDGTGTVTGVAPGHAKITVTTADGGYTQSYTVVVPAAGNAAKIGSAEYATLDAAFAALEDGQTVVLLHDVMAQSITLGTSKANCSLDLNGYALVANQVTVPAGVSLKSIANGVIDVYSTSNVFGTFEISGAVDRLSDLAVTGSFASAYEVSFKVSPGAQVSVIEDCDITGVVEVHGTANLITGTTVTGMVSAVGQSNPTPYTGRILNMSNCTVTANVAGGNYGAVITQRGEVYIYSGTYTNINPGDSKHPSYTVTYYHGGVAMIYGGRFKGGRLSALNGTANGIRDGGITIASGYALSGEPDGEGYYTVVPSISTGTVTFKVTPADAALTVTRTSDNAVQTPTSSTGGTRVYIVTMGVDYTYSLSKAGYVTKSGPFRMEALSTLEIPITLTAEGSTEPTTPGTVSGGATITSGGTYTVESGATGTIVVMTREPVKLVGRGISGSDAKFSDLTIDCSVAGVNLTLKDIWINNNVGQGTASGNVNFGLNIIRFTGTGNSLSCEGVNLLETQEYVQGAAINVPKGAELTIYGPGTLYMYKYSQGAGIGGNSYEACGKITFAGADVFIKGSKTGPLVGGDSLVEGVKNDPIYITSGTLVLINKANGAAIGASKQGKCAGPVYLQGGNLTIISDFLGSAIGYGGDRSSTPGNLYVSGGSFKAVRTDNSLKLNGDSATQTPDDTLVTATKQNGSGTKAVSLLLFDTTKLSKSASFFTASSMSGFTYSGGLHKFRYTETTSSTVDNFGYDSSDRNLYFYLPMETQTLTVNGETFKVTWNATSGTFTVTKIESGKTDSTTTTKTVTVDVTTNGTISTATVSSSALSEAVTAALADAAKNGTKAAVELSIDAPSSSTTVNAVIPTTALSSAASSGITSLTVTTPIGSMTLDSTALKTISGQASGSDITLSIQQVDKTKLTAAQQKAVGDGTVVSLSVTSGNTVIHDFGGGSATVSIPYTLKTGEKADGIVIWYMADDGTLTQVESASYDPATDTVTFTTTHFSNYVIGYDPAAAWKNPFSDITKTDWFYADTYYVYTNGLFTGTSATTFAPSTPMTRAMFVTVLGRLAGVKASDYTTSSFTDVKTGQWYSAYVEWAAKNGIVTGVGEKLFNPDGQITRQEMAVILYRYAQYKKADMSTSKDLTAFSDASETSSWASDAMTWAVSKGLINGMGDGSLSPLGTATRAQVAAIIHRFAIL